jgi:hypothetical protein
VSAARLLLAALLGADLCCTAAAWGEEAWHRLTPAQLSELRSTLAPTHVVPVAPRVLPKGFRLVAFSVDAVPYVNGDFDAGYSLDYRGPANRCLALTSTKSGPRGLDALPPEPSPLGSVPLYRTPAGELEPTPRQLVAFLPVSGSQILMTPSYPTETPEGAFVSCTPISEAEFRRVVGSLERLP